MTHITLTPPSTAASFEEAAIVYLEAQLSRARAHIAHLEELCRLNGVRVAS